MPYQDLKERVGRVIDDRMTEMEIKDADLARRLSTKMDKKIHRQNVGNWRKGRALPSPGTAPYLAAELQLPLSALSAAPNAKLVNVAFRDGTAQTVTQVPRVSRTEAGKGRQITDPYPMGQGRDFYETALPVSKNTIALDVWGDSMEPEFFEGETIVVDPEVKPEKGSYVVAEIYSPETGPGDGDVTFKQYVPRGEVNGVEVFDLVPLNSAHDTVTVRAERPGRIIGTVVEHRRILAKR